MIRLHPLNRWNVSNCWCEKCTPEVEVCKLHLSSDYWDVRIFFDLFLSINVSIHPLPLWKIKTTHGNAFVVYSFFSMINSCLLNFTAEPSQKSESGFKTFGWGKKLTLAAEQQQHIPRPVYHNQTLIKPLCKQSLCLCASGITLNLILSVLIWVLLWANLFSMILSCSLGSLLQLRFRKPNAWAPNTICLWNNSSIWIHLLICPGTNYMYECTRPTFPTPFISALSLRQVDQLPLQTEGSQVLNLNEPVKVFAIPCVWQTLFADPCR